MNGARTHVATVNLSTVSDPRAMPRAIDALAGLSWITALTATAPRLEDAHVRTISSLRSLESLNLTGSQFPVSATDHLARLRRLKALYLAGTTVTNQVIPALSRFQELRILDLSGTAVTGEFQPLRKLPQLEWLLLRDLELGDDSIVELVDSPSLKRLTLEGCTCSEETLATIHSRRPGLVVER
jgi:hypothetical protein